MSFSDAALALLKDRLLPEIGELRKDVGGIKDVLGAMLTRLESLERESVRRFEQMDKRFEQIDKRIEETSADHARRMDLLDRRIELVEGKLERLGERVETQGERIGQLTDAVGRLSLLGDFVKRVDEMSAELRELRRRQDTADRRLADEVLPRLPRTGS